MLSRIYLSVSWVFLYILAVVWVEHCPVFNFKFVFNIALIRILVSPLFSLNYYLMCQACVVFPRPCSSLPDTVLSTTVFSPQFISTTFSISSSTALSAIQNNYSRLLRLPVCCSSIIECPPTFAAWSRFHAYWIQAVAENCSVCLMVFIWHFCVRLQTVFC